MEQDKGDYFAYMLRLWQANERGAPVWRASLESPHTGERLGFASLDHLVAFLRTKTADGVDRQEPTAPNAIPNHPGTS